MPEQPTASIQMIAADDPLSRSADVVADNVAMLKTMFPELVTEGANGASINPDVLKQLVGDRTVTDAEEKFGLNWYGKRQARQLALTPSTGTLRPCPAESLEWETTQNLFIEGDNLEVIKLLQKSYATKVKLIYIDPPYNQDADVIYVDDFRDGLRNYKMLTGQIASDGRQLTSATEASGRHHTNWLNMMYPRLKAAHALLRRDGLLFVSIDDNEVATLRMILSEIFGEENFEGHIHWRRRHNQPNDRTKMLGLVTEHILCFARDKAAYKAAGVGKVALTGNFTNPDGDPRGEWASKPWKVGSDQSGSRYSITTPTGVVHDEEWMGEEATFLALQADKRIIFPDGGNGSPRKKYFRSEREEEGQCATNWWPHDQFGHNQAANTELESLLGEKNLFSNPKPLDLLKGILAVSNTKNDDIVMDFFAGSATTAHAVLSQNVEDGGRRRFIVVQLDEPIGTTDEKQRRLAEYCDRLGKPRNIAELSKHRIRQVVTTLRNQTPLFPGDLGCRMFKLDYSNVNEWRPDRSALASSLESAVAHMAPGRTAEDVLFELLIKRGLDLCVPIEQRLIAGRTVYAVGAGSLMACLASPISRADTEQLAMGIVQWHAELNPAGDTAVVFRDDAFDDDVVKTNLAAILEQHGLKTVRSI